MSIGKEIILTDVLVLGLPSTFAVTEYSENDLHAFEKYFKAWKELALNCEAIDSRVPNLGEAFTEGLFCLWSGSYRYLKQAQCSIPFTEKLSHASLDTYHLPTQKSEQIKSTIADRAPSTFGPKSKEDSMYFMDFFNSGNVDGTFTVYPIPLNILHSTILNKDRNETFDDQCAQRRRPRLKLLTQVIEPNNIQPLVKNVRLW
jgi:hypothetical protein